MEFRRLGRSGLTVSEIAYGNWITHGSQVEEEAAHACVRAALDSGPGSPPPAGSRATDQQGAAIIRRMLADAVLERVQQPGPVATDVGLSMAQPAIAWVLQNDNVAAAIIGASRPEQVVENVKAAGIRLEPAVLARIDEILGDAVARDPAKTG